MASREQEKKLTGACGRAWGEGSHLGYHLTLTAICLSVKGEKVLSPNTFDTVDNSGLSSPTCYTSAWWVGTRTIFWAKAT